jgi:hypothetical protein
MDRFAPLLLVFKIPHSATEPWIRGAGSVWLFPVFHGQPNALQADSDAVKPDARDQEQTEQYGRGSFIRALRGEEEHREKSEQYKQDDGRRESAKTQSSILVPLGRIVLSVHR